MCRYCCGLCKPKLLQFLIRAVLFFLNDKVKISKIADSRIYSWRHFILDANWNCNPPNHFCGLSLDKCDHVIQNRPMDIRGYQPSDLISVVWSYFDGRKTKKQANLYAKLWIGQRKPKKTFYRSQWRINKKLVDNSVPRNTKKNPQNMQERSTSVRLEKLFGGL